MKPNMAQLFGQVQKMQEEVEKIQNKLDNIVITEVSKWKFEPAVINGKKVKFLFDLQFVAPKLSGCLSIASVQ